MDRVDMVAAHAAEAMHSVAVQDNPFPHLLVPDLLPADVYRAALAHWPERASMAVAQPDYYLHRYSTVLDERWLATLNPEVAEVWRAVRAALCGPAAIDALLTRFPAAVERLRMFGSGAPVPNVCLIEDEGGHAILPHTDTPATALTALLYMPETTGEPQLGTALYRPHEPVARSAGYTYHPREGFEHVGTAPYLPNRLLAFAPGDTTFHGVEPVTGPAIRRLVRLFAFADTRGPRR